MKDLKCPRDQSLLKEGHEHGVEIDRCGTCGGAWYDNDELSMLEATVADEDSRRGMIDYAKRDSELHCPVCKQKMRAFNYRANNLELDACTEDHGFWLDANEAERVRQLMVERVEGLQRAGVAESEWGDFLRAGGKKGGGFFKNLFGGGKK
jgi:Zn-finger nucleic acid-binding protein